MAAGRFCICLPLVFVPFFFLLSRGTCDLVGPEELGALGVVKLGRIVLKGKLHSFGLLVNLSSCSKVNYLRLKLSLIEPDLSKI